MALTDEWQNEPDTPESSAPHHPGQTLFMQLSRSQRVRPTSVGARGRQHRADGPSVPQRRSLHGALYRRPNLQRDSICGRHSVAPDSTRCLAFPLSSRPSSKNSSEIGFTFCSNPSSVVELRTYVCAGAHASVRDRICMCGCEPGVRAGVRRCREGSERACVRPRGSHGLPAPSSLAAFAAGGRRGQLRPQVGCTAKYPAAANTMKRSSSTNSLMPKRRSSQGGRHHDLHTEGAHGVTRKMPMP